MPADFLPLDDKGRGGFDTLGLAVVVVEFPDAFGLGQQARILAGFEDEVFGEILRLHQVGIAAGFLGIDGQQWGLVDWHGASSLASLFRRSGRKSKIVARETLATRAFHIII